MSDNSSTQASKIELRGHLRRVLSQVTPEARHQMSIAACSLLTQATEFSKARVIMLFLSTPHEIDTAPLALKAWQAGKTVVVPKVSWDQRRMLPVEINSLNTGLQPSGPDGKILEPIAGNPIPMDIIDLVIVPALGFSPTGYRIGRGMGFYDRFLAQSDFHGLTCGYGYESQVVSPVPVLDHDIPLAMLATDRGIRRFASHCIEHA